MRNIEKAFSQFSTCFFKLISSGLINEYVEENADREILKRIAEKRGSICNALKSGEDAQHKVLRKLRRKYLKP